jgi:hypothetical protein
MRRLTVREYGNTVRDLLGVAPDVARTLVQDSPTDGFDNNVAGQLVALSNVQQQLAVAETIAAQAAADLAKLVACDVSARGEAACAREFIARMGKRAYRRPPTADETAILTAVYESVRRAGDFRAAIARTLQAMLSAPQFLYRLELTEGTPRADRSVRLSGFEIATRLSYLLWSSMPDAELFAAAEANRLQAPADVLAQARRMLADPRARSAVAGFHEQWLGFDEIATVEKDPARYPRFTASARRMLHEEVGRFVDHVFWQEGGRLGALLGATYSFRSETLAGYYADPGYVKATVADPNEFRRVELDPAVRRGILSQGGFIAAISASEATSPIHRGKIVFERFLCGVVPPPLPDAADQVQEVKGPATARQRLAYLTSTPACAPCHRLMNPIGLALENYDGIGRWRTRDEGLPIDPSGELLGTDVDGPLAGPGDLARRIAASGKARGCMAATWFRFTHGRSERPADACALGELERAYAASDASARELLLALVRADGFVHRALPEGGVR